MLAPFAAALLATSSVLPSTSTAAVAALDAAKRALDAQRPREALDALGPRSLGASNDPLRDLLTAKALAELEEREQALAALGPEPEAGCLPAEEDVGRQARAELTASLLATSDPNAAARALASLGTPEGWSAALALARGPSRGAIERALLLEGAGSPEAVTLFTALGVEGVLARFPEPEQRLELTEAWLEAHDNPRAEALAAALRPALASDPVARCRLDYVVGKAARKLRKYRRAGRILTQARKRCLDASAEAPAPARAVLRDRAIRSALLEARVAAIRGRAGAIDRLVAWMQAHFPGHSYIDDAALWSAEAKRGASATAALRATLALEGDQAPEAAWRLAQAAMVARRLDAARPLLARIGEMPGASVDDRERAEHFLARILARSSTAAAAARWRRLARHPSFYGFMAAKRLREVDPAGAAEVQRALERAARAPGGSLGARIRTLPAVTRAALWHRAGFSDWAEAELRAAACALEDPTPEDTLGLALALDAVGAHPAAQRLLRWDPRRLLDGALTSANAPLWRAAYSRAYVDEIAAAAEAERIDPLLLTALAREESTFDPDIVSWAGATGLAQLMPATAVGAYADVFGGRLDEARPPRARPEPAPRRAGPEGRLAQLWRGRAHGPVRVQRRRGADAADPPGARDPLRAVDRVEPGEGESGLREARDGDLGGLPAPLRAGARRPPAAGSRRPGRARDLLT